MRDHAGQVVVGRHQIPGCGLEGVGYRVLWLGERGDEREPADGFGVIECERQRDRAAEPVNNHDFGARAAIEIMHLSPADH